jgi:uncharacterized membrane protein
MTPAKTKWLIGALVLSLGINLYAGTFLLGHRTRQHMATANLARKQLDDILGTLPRERQMAIRSTLKDDIEQMRKNLRDARAEREKLATLMSAPRMDKAAINAEFAEMRKQTSEAQEDLQRITLKAFAQMTPEERKSAMDRNPGEKEKKQ